MVQCCQRGLCSGDPEVEVHHVQEGVLLRNAVAFYRLMATWLLRLAYPPLAQGQLPFVPLPEPAPASFRTLPVRSAITSSFQTRKTRRTCCDFNAHANAHFVHGLSPSLCLDSIASSVH